MARRTLLAERPVLVAPDSFKGSLRATEVAAAIGRGLEAAGLLPPDLCPIADGGEGTLEVLLPALGGETAVARVHDPIGREMRAGFALLEGGTTALVEVAAAGGPTLLDESERDVEQADSYGTGELIGAALDTGVAVVLVAAGGSATVDGGAGALRALAERGGCGEARLVVLCDVRTPWEAAAERFGPQKGADAATVTRLAQRLEELADRLPRDPRGVPGGGAAGGLAGGLWAAHGAVLERGAAWVLDALGFDRRMRAARAVITGEGRLDATTLEGKAVWEVGTRSRQAGVPLHAIVGTDALSAFDKRIIDLMVVAEAGSARGIEAAAARLGAALATGAA